MKFSKDKLIIALLSLMIYLVLDYTFKHIINDNYDEFKKFLVGKTSFWVYLLSYLFPIGLTLILIALRTSELIYCILCLLVVLIIYPTTILWRHLNTDATIIWLYGFYFLMVYLISNSFKIKLAIPQIAETQKTNILFGLAFILVIPFIVIYFPHLNFQNLTLAASSIYKARDLEVTLSNNYTGYVYSLLSNVILPLLLLLAFLHKEYIKATITFVLLIFMFLVGGHKSVFFGAFLTLFFFRGGYLTKIKVLFFGISLVLMASIVTYFLSNNFMLVSLFARRIFLLPAILEIGYFDYFDDKPIYWSASILRNFVVYPFDMPPVNLIGKHVLSSATVNANNGIVSDGYMNFGVVGSMINIIFVSIIYGVLNSLNLSHRFFGLIFLLFFTFMSTYFFTTMITHGGLLLIALAYFFLKNSRILYNDN